MPSSLSISAANKQYVVLTIDGGSKPSGTEKYRIERKENSLSSANYLIVAETTSAVYNDHPRPRNLAGNLIAWDYRVKAYLTASGWDSGIVDDNAGSGYEIAAVTDAQITSSGALGAATSAGTFSNTYLAQAESKPTGSTNSDQETWVILEILPLTASSV